MFGAGDTGKKKWASLSPHGLPVWWEDRPEIPETATQITSVLVVMGAMTAKDGKLERDGEDPLQIAWPLSQDLTDEQGPVREGGGPHQGAQHGQGP